MSIEVDIKSTFNEFYELMDDLQSSKIAYAIKNSMNDTIRAVGKKSSQRIRKRHLKLRAGSAGGKDKIPTGLKQYMKVYKVKTNSITKMNATVVFKKKSIALWEFLSSKAQSPVSQKGVSISKRKDIMVKIKPNGKKFKVKRGFIASKGNKNIFRRTGTNKKKYNRIGIRSLASIARTNAFESNMEKFMQLRFKKSYHRNLKHQLSKSKQKHLKGRMR